MSEREKSLSEDLKDWRAERPDEWTMDRFIIKAKALRDENKRLKEALVHVQYRRRQYERAVADQEYGCDDAEDALYFLDKRITEALKETQNDY